MNKPKILIVEDELATMNMIKNNLKRIIECDIDESHDGQNAIDKIQKSKYDLVIFS